jgi:hypothetical protein
MNLNTKRLALSNTLMDLENQINALEAAFIEALTFKQFRHFQSYHLRVGYIAAYQLHSITKSKKLKTMALKASVLVSKAHKVDSELEAVLIEMNAVGPESYVTA